MSETANDSQSPEFVQDVLVFADYICDDVAHVVLHVSERVQAGRVRAQESVQVDIVWALE